MIWITGDTHIPIDLSKLYIENFPEQETITKDDYVIICGDFGGVWSKDEDTKDGRKESEWLDWIDSRNFTTLFIDGNHENFTRLNALPEYEWNGGHIHKVRPSIYHLMRGHIFNINGSTFFTMGGAQSHDRGDYVGSKPWWKEEMPSAYEYSLALYNLDKCDWSVDYVITHCAPDSIQGALASWYEHDKLTNFLETIKFNLRFRQWFLSHYHIDRVIGSKFTVVYNKIIKLK